MLTNTYQVLELRTGEENIMSTSITPNQYEVYMKLIDHWNNCTHFGIVISRVDRMNDIPNYLVKLGVSDLIRYLLVNEKMNAFVYMVDLGRKNPVQVLEIYHDMRLRATEWRERRAEIAMRIDDDLVDGLDDGIAIPEFVVPFVTTAMREVKLTH